MKSYTITVNGVAYDVTVEENTSVSVPVRTQKPAPAGSPKAASKIPTAGGGSVKISAGAAGKVYKIEKEAGASVKKGDTVIAGQPLLKFDMDFITSEGYPLVTPVLIVNAEDFGELEFVLLLKNNLEKRCRKW